MIQEQYCGLKEHQIVTSVCVLYNCNYQSRLVCKQCNSKQFHNHNQETNIHLLDLEIILNSKEVLKDQSQQYHFKIMQIYEMQNLIQNCQSQLYNLNDILNKQLKDYKKYVQNLHMIQIHLNSKDFQMTVDYKLAEIMKEVNDFSKYQNRETQDVFKNLLNYKGKLKDKIQSKGDSDSKLFQVVNHKYQIQFAQISPNGQDLLFGSQKKLYSFNIQQCSYQEICDISNKTQSFVISKDYQQFYFDYNGAIKIFNRNLGNCQQTQLQKCEMEFIMVLSKTLAVVYFKSISKCYIVNLKSRKKIFKFLCVNIVDMYYIEDQNLLIVAYLNHVDVITLNSKFKSYQLDHNNTSNVNIQFNQQNQQLILINTKGVLTLFWDLQRNGQFTKKSFQIQIQQRTIKYFRFNQNLQQCIVFTSSEIIFCNVQGQILQRLNHSYKDLVYQNTFSNYCQDPIIFRIDDSITLLRVNQM